MYGLMGKDETQAMWRFVGQLRYIVAAMILLLIVVGALSGNQQTDSSLLNCLVLPILVIIGFVIFIVLILILSLASYLMAGVAWIIVLPYDLLDGIVERARLQSTLVFGGLIVGTVGIMLTG